MSKEEHAKLLIFELAHRSVPQVIVETTFLVFIAVTALVGNSCVLCVFYRSSSLLQLTSYYHVTLAISSGCLALLVLPTTIAVAVSGRDCIGKEAGQVIGFIFTELILGSFYTISLISINRFLCVAKPLVYKKYFKKKLTLFTIFGIWIFSLLFLLGVYTSARGIFKFYPARFVYLPAFYDLTTEKTFRAVFQVVFIIFPMSISIICCWKVYKIVKGHKDRTAFKFNGSAQAGNNCKFSIREINITKSLMASVFSFIFCWMPCTTIFHVAVYVDLPRFVELISMYTAFFSCSFSPIVLNIFNRSFRRQFLKILCSARKNNKIAVGQALRHN